MKGKGSVVFFCCFVFALVVVVVVPSYRCPKSVISLAPLF